VDALWNLITLPALNLPAREASLALAVKVFRTGLLDDAGAGDIGWSLVPLGRLHGDAAAGALERAGVEVHLRAQATAIDVAPPGAHALGGAGHDGAPLEVVCGESRWPADAVVVAVPHEAAARLLPPSAVGDKQLLELGTSPIVDVHVVYDRPITGVSMAAALGSFVQWVFDRTAASGLEKGQYLAVSVSGAAGHLGRRPEELTKEATTALAGLFPAAAGAQVIDAFVSKERAATFRQAPGTRALRPGPRSAIPGLYLAGAWTDTGWPATMEGAVRSGLAAAACALAPGSGGGGVHTIAPGHTNAPGRANKPGDELPLSSPSTATSLVDPVTLEVRR
jgi:hypothetical protein